MPPMLYLCTVGFGLGLNCVVKATSGGTDLFCYTDSLFFIFLTLKD